MVVQSFQKEVLSVQRVIGLFNKIDKRSFFLYILVGGLSTVINYGLFSLCYGIFKTHYQVALTIGYFSGAFFNFSANRYVTFQSHNNAAHTQLIKYIIVMFSNYFANLGLAHIGVEYLKLSPYLAVLIALGIMVCITYFASKYWVFTTDSKFS